MTFPSWNQSKQSEAIDFSIGEEYGNVPLSHSDKKFLVKFFQEKWGIDPRDTYNVHYMYKKFLGAGIALATVGGTVSLIGLMMMPILATTNGFGGFISAGFPIAMVSCLAVGFPLLAMSSWPFMIADATKRIYTKFTGQRSFTPRISSTGGFCGEERKLEIALGYQF